MKLLVCGSRTITDKEYIYRCIMDAIKISTFPITQIIEGNADGVDKGAGFYAIERAIKLETFPPDWSLGKGAGYIRNKEMVDVCDKGIAIWDGISKGTKDTIIGLRKQGKLFKIYRREVKNR